MQGRALGYEVGLPAELHQHGLVDVVRVEQAADIAQVEDAHGIVDVAPVDGQTRVLAAAYQPQDLVDGVVQVDADDFVARHHDVVHGDLFQIENAQQHVLVPARQHGAGFVHQGPKFLATESDRCSGPLPVARPSVAGGCW